MLLFGKLNECPSMTSFQDINITTWSCVKYINWAQEMVDSTLNDSRAFRVSYPLTLTRMRLCMVTLDHQLGMTYSVSVRDYWKQSDGKREIHPHCETHSGVQNSIKRKRMRAEHQRSPPSASSLGFLPVDTADKPRCTPLPRLRHQDGVYSLNYKMKWTPPILHCFQSGILS